MTMFVQLLVLACAFALSTADIQPPHYEQALRDIEDTWDIINQNVLSMDGNIPLLNDYRRQYTEIIYVIMYEGMVQAGCFHKKYFEEYPESLNISAPEAIKNPEEVIAEIKRVFEAFDERTSELQDLIRECFGDDQYCDRYVDEIVNQDKNLQIQRNKFMAAGDFASILKENTAEYEAIAKKFSTNKFVINGANELERIINAYNQLYRELFLYPSDC